MVFHPPSLRQEEPARPGAEMEDGESAPAVLGRRTTSDEEVPILERGLRRRARGGAETVLVEVEESAEEIGAATRGRLGIVGRFVWGVFLNLISDSSGGTRGGWKCGWCARRSSSSRVSVRKSAPLEAVVPSREHGDLLVRGNSGFSAVSSLPAALSTTPSTPHLGLYRSDVCRGLLLHGQGWWEPTTVCGGARVRLIKSDTPRALAKRITGVWDNCVPTPDLSTAPMSGLWRKACQKVWRALLTSVKSRNVIAADFGAADYGDCSWRLDFSVSLRLWGRRQICFCEQACTYYRRPSCAATSDDRSDPRSSEPLSAAEPPVSRTISSASSSTLKGALTVTPRDPDEGGRGGPLFTTGRDNMETLTHAGDPLPRNPHTPLPRKHGVPDVSEEEEYAALLDLIFSERDADHDNEQELEKELRRFGWTVSEERVPHPFLKPGRIFWRFCCSDALCFLIVNPGSIFSAATVHPAEIVWEVDQSGRESAKISEEEETKGGGVGVGRRRQESEETSEEAGVGGDQSGRGSEDETCRHLYVEFTLFSEARGVEVTRHSAIAERCASA